MAANQLSPGVVIQERDLTTITTLSTANIGVLAAPFELGPIEEVVQISSERELVERFGKPNEYNYEYWFTASQFLAYGGVLKTIRVTSTALKNAVDAGTAPLIKNLQAYETTHEGASNTWTWASRTAGAKGNSIGIFMTDAGADQIAVLPAPSSNEYVFVNDQLVGGRARTYKYSFKVSMDTLPSASISVGDKVSIDQDAASVIFTVRAWDEANKKLELTLDGIDLLSDGNTVTANDGTNIEVLGNAETFYAGSLANNPGGASDALFTSTEVTRELVIGLDEDASEFAAAETIVDDTAGTPQSIDITSVRSEYAEREYVPGSKWLNVAARPGTSQYASNAGGHNDELHILVVDIDGKITGTTGAVLERFIGLSKASDAKTTIGETNYYKEVIKQRSNYIYWGSHEDSVFDATATSSDGDWGAAASSRNFNRIRWEAGVQSYPAGYTGVGSYDGATAYYRLTGGVDYAAAGSDYTITNTDITTAYELIEDPESQRVDFILAGPSGSSDSNALAKITSLVNIVEERRDCMVFVSPRRSNVIGVSSATTATDNLVAFFDQLPSSSYMVFDSGYKYIYDKYNDVYRYVPCNGDVAGLCLQTTEVSEPWFSPAGFQRGVLRNAIKLAFSPNKTQRDRLYAARVNPIVSFPGQGIVLFGDKTALGFASAFDRINVRRLFLTIERVIGGAAKSQLFEQNDEAQRSLFLNIVEPYMRDVQGRRGVTDFLVKCDSENNPPESVDRGEFYAEIYVKPTRTINYITLTFTATRTGVAFGEIAS